MHDMDLKDEVRYSGSTRVWNTHTDSVIDPIEADVARQRHEAGESYGAVVPLGEVLAAVAIGDTGKVRTTIHGLPGTLFYAFDAIGGRLWLKEIQRRNGHGRYGKDGFPPSTCAHFYRWDPEGSADIACFDDETPRGRILVERDDWDRDVNWFDRPDFGDYTQVADPDLLDRVWPDAPPMPPSTG